MTIYILRTVGGREKLAAKEIERQVDLLKLPIKAILVTEQVRGYIFIEADTVEPIRKLFPHTRHLMKRLFGKVSVNSVMKYLSPTAPVDLLHVDDYVMIIAGPFKSLQARVKSLDRKKGMVGVSLLDSHSDVTVMITADAVKPVEMRR